MKLKEAKIINKTFQDIYSQVQGILASKYTVKSKECRIMSIWNSAWDAVASEQGGIARLFMLSIRNMLTKSILADLTIAHVLRYIELLHDVMCIYEEEE